MIGNSGIVGSREVLVCLHIDHVLHILRDTMSKGVVRPQQTGIVGNLLEVFVEHLLRVDDGTDLKEVEGSSRP